MTREEFRGAMLETQDLYGKVIQDRQMDAWWAKLNVYTVASFKRALDLAATESRGFPSYGAVAKHLDPGTIQRSGNPELYNGAWYEPGFLDYIRGLAASLGRDFDEFLAWRQGQVEEARR